MVETRVKICGITQALQAQEILQLGADALGFICVPQSPRFIPPEKIRAIIQSLSSQTWQGHRLKTIGVFANASFSEMQRTLDISLINGIQLHGDESIETCQRLKQDYPTLELIKAFRIKEAKTLTQAQCYTPTIDTFLFDAYHPTEFGGTGETWDWSSLKEYTFQKPWFLAGGLNASNVLEAIAQVQPPGIDLSSGVESTPGQKDLAKVKALFCTLGRSTPQQGPTHFNSPLSSHKIDIDSHPRLGSKSLSSGRSSDSVP